jgi:hypothetical protein
MAQGLGVWQPHEAIELAPDRAAAELERVFGAAGLPTRISQLGIPRESLPAVVAHSLKNFNADPKREFRREADLLGEVIDAAW